MYTYYSIYNNHLFHKQILPLSPAFSKHYTYDNPTIFPKSYKKVPAILFTDKEMETACLTASISLSI